MVVKKSKSVALDSRDIHSVFSQMKGYGPLMALGIIAVLSVCAAFFIYRSTKGQSKRNGENSVTEPVEEDEKGVIEKRRDEDKHAESTGIMEESQGMTPADPSEETPVESPFETSDLASALHDLEEETGEAWRESAIAEDDAAQDDSSDLKADPDDQTVPDGELGDAQEQEHTEEGAENDNDDLVITQCGDYDNEDNAEHQNGLVGDVNEALQELSDYLEKDGLKIDDSLKMDLDLHKDKADDQLCSPDSAYGDEDNGGEPELEKTTRARDLRSSSTNTVDQDFTYYQQSCADCPTEPPAVDHHHPREDEQKSVDDALTWCMQRIHKDTETMMQPAQQYTPDVPFYKPDYLSFSPEGFPVMDGCMRVKPDMVSPLALDPIQSVRSGEKEDQAQSQEPQCDKTEINIMEATMDNNEWLTGSEAQPCGGRGHDMPWLSLSDGDGGDADSSSVAEESQQNPDWDTEKSEVSEELSETAASSDLDLEDLTATTKRVVVSPVPPQNQKVHVTFSVHYITVRPSQLLAVTGNRQELGAWRGFVPLERRKGGLWSSTVALALPVVEEDNWVEWKFVVVEDGEIWRWEECDNRQLVLNGREEDVHVQKWWGCL